MSSNIETFAKNLRYYVERSGKLQTEIADTVGVTKSAFTSWVKGEKYPRIDKIEALANYFGIQKSDLIEAKLSDEELEGAEPIDDIVVKARMDLQFYEILKMINDMNEAQLELLKHYLEALMSN